MARGATRPRPAALTLIAACIVVLNACAPSGVRMGASPSASQSAHAVVAASAGCGHAPLVPPGHDMDGSVSLDPAMQAGTKVRTFRLYVPQAYTDTQPAPLIMEFHGAAPNATAQGYEQGSPLHRLADADHFLDVFPQGLRAPNGNLAWNAYGPVYWRVAEIPFINAVLDDVEAHFCVDTTRVYASGVSNGGNMVNYAACRDAARFAAVAPVVGPMYGQDDGPCRPSRPVPIIDIHSVNDPVVTYAGLPGPPYYDFPLPSVTSWLEGWSRLDGCPASPVSSSGGAGVTVRTWNTCEDGARIVAYATEAGHGWPATLDGQPAASVVWSFLHAFRLSG